MGGGGGLRGRRKYLKVIRYEWGWGGRNDKVGVKMSNLKIAARNPEGGLMGRWRGKIS